MNIYQLSATLRVRPRDIVAAVRDGTTIGEYAWDIGDREALAEMDLDGWPNCECCGCGCTEPATTTDDGGVPVCSECAEYAVDENGEVHCSRCGDIEIVTECCGAGGQTRSYARIAPPEMPETDPDGRYALYWETVGDDEHVVARFASLTDAEQAVEAQDWPKPGDHTNYLCGYGVRQLIDNKWMPVDDDYS